MKNISAFICEIVSQLIALLVIIAVFSIPLMMGLFGLSLAIVSIIASINGDSDLFMCQIFHWGCIQ